MADKFELLSPGDACAAALPVNLIKDDYSITRLVNLRMTEGGETQAMVLPRGVVHPQFNKIARERLSGQSPDKISGGRALLRKWSAPLESKQSAAGDTPPSAHGINAATVDVLLPSYEFALYLPYAQAWELLGYSRGTLLNSVSLAPQEESTIEIFSWERMKRTREDTLGVDRESAHEVAFTDKDTREVLKEVTKDSSFTFHAGLEVQVPVGDVPVGGSVEVETKDSLRDVSRSTQQTVNEAVRKASVRMKTSRQTKITESEEVGRETKVTRKLRNPNVCRTLNIDMFEILANYRVTTTLLHERIRLCVLVPIPISMEVNRQFLLAHEGALQRALLSSAYASGFEAARLLATWQRLCEVKCAPPCPCEQPPGGPGSDDPAVVAARQQVEAAAGAVAASINAVNGATPEDLCALACFERAGTDADWAAAKLLFHRWLYGKLMDLIASRWWAACRLFAQDTDRSPQAAERFLLEANAQPADLFNLALLAIRFIGTAASIVNTLIAEGCWNILVLITNIAFNDAGLDGTVSQLRSAVAAYRAAVDAVRNPPAQQPPGDAQAQAPAPEFPPQDLAKALVDEAALMAHIDGNAAYYRFAIWQALAPSDRATLLAGQGNLMSFLEPEVLGYSGTKIALPFRLGADAEVAEWFEGNVRDNPGLKEAPEPFAITLQTPGVMTETRLGQCDACEDFILQSRNLDLQQKAAEVLAAQQRAEQEKLETQRYQMRLAQKQPLLEDPDPNQGQSPVRVVIDKTP
jgi:hypothetical protein